MRAKRVARMIKQTRIDKEISADAVSCALGMGANFIYDIEAGRCNLGIRHVWPVSRFLGIDTEMITMAYMLDVKDSIEESLHNISREDSNVQT